MIEMILLCFYTIPLGIWLSISIIPEGLNRDPVAFSVNEMLAFLISTILVASCIFLVRGYRTTKNEGNGYSILYGLLISIGSLFTALLLASRLLSMGIELNAITYIVGVAVFILIPFIGVSRVWLRLRHYHI